MQKQKCEILVGACSQRVFRIFVSIGRTPDIHNPDAKQTDYEWHGEKNGMIEINLNIMNNKE